MNKRTILFILLVSATFMGFNLFFSYDRDKKNRARLAQQEKLSEKKHVALQEEIEAKTEQIDALPLAQLFASDSATDPLSTAIYTNNNALTIAWANPMPKEIYVKQNGSSKLLTLKTEDVVLGAPVLYVTSDFESLDIANVPDEGVYDLQLVTFPKEGGFSKVLWGEYSDGTLEVPAGEPDVAAIALFKTDYGYLPLGFFEPEGSVFILLQNLPLFSDITTPFGFTEQAPEPGEQKYYVLENAYQQLVFTDVGGALAEINLPFASDENKKSVVNEIGFDRDIIKQSPPNAHFPLYPYYRASSKELIPNTDVGGYYPLIRRNLLNQGAATKAEIPPQFYSLNIVSEYPELAKLKFTVKEFTDKKIVFEATQSMRRITKTYTLVDDAPYVFDLTVDVQGDSRGLWLTSGLPEVEIMSRNSAPLIQYRTTRGKKSEVEKLDKPKPKEVVTVSSVSPDWVANSNGYFGIIQDPLSDIAPGYRAKAIPGGEVPTRLTLIDPAYNLYKAADYPGYQVLLPLPRGGGKMTFRLYAGPFQEEVLKAVDKRFRDSTTGYNPDYIACRTFYGWFSFISEPFAKLLYVVMKFFHTITGSWGISIILLTVFLKVLLYPLNAWSIKSMRRMQQVSPQVKAIQAKYKKEPKKSQAEIMKLYRKEKVNPFMGCIPILIQIPFLIGMFDLLKSSFSLRGASFIPGWIDNLTAPDVLFSWSQPIFFIGNQFHLLPILLGVVMFFQQRISQGMNKNVGELTDQQRQQRSMGTIMTVVFTVLFYHFPSGLNIYWLSSMILGIGQQWFTNKMLDKKGNGEKKLAVKR